jgi:hypothetical protein
MTQLRQAQGLVLLFRDGAWRYCPDGEGVSVSDGEHPVVLVWEEGDITDEVTGAIGWAQVQFIEEPAPKLCS